MSHVWTTSPTLKAGFVSEEEAFKRFCLESENNIDDLRHHGVLFSFSTDSMLPETISLTSRAAHWLVRNKIPVYILTKSTWWFDEFIMKKGIWKWLEDNSLQHKRFFTVGFTLTGHNELETGPFAATAASRRTTLKKLHFNGYRTWASIEPIVDFVSSYEEIFKLYTCCDLFKIGLMSHKSYDIEEAREFIRKLLEFNSNYCRFYIKRSLAELVDLNSMDLPDNFVDSSYHLLT